MLSGKWVAVWGSAPSEPIAVPAVYAKDITLRFNLRSPLNGKALRLHFNNLYGKEDFLTVQEQLMSKLQAAFAKWSLPPFDGMKASPTGSGQYGPIRREGDPVFLQDLAFFREQ